MKKHSRKKHAKNDGRENMVKTSGMVCGLARFLEPVDPCESACDEEPQTDKTK